MERKVVIVTGGASGLGLCIAQRFSSDGAIVVVADIRNSAAVAAALSSEGRTAKGIDTDVADWNSVRSLVESVSREFGKIDVLVNNAAIASNISLTPFEEVGTDDFMKMLAVNTVGTFHCCKGVAPLMRRQGWGRIINMASGTALRGMPLIVPYVASKGAVIAMTRSLAQELGSDGITVNAVSPGYTLTQANLDNASYREAVRPGIIAMRALKRDAVPEDIVGTVAFLAGEDAGFITGQILAVDGGATYQ